MDLSLLSDKQKERLKANWGEKADSLACYAEVRVYDPLSPWECYLYAMNPEDEDEVETIVKASKMMPASLERWYMTNILGLFNQDGEGVEVDEEYRPIRASELFKKLNEGTYDR